MMLRYSSFYGYGKKRKSEMDLKKSESDFWRKVEIILLLTAFGLFAFAEYNRAYFIMLVLIHNRLLKDK
jgi:hypothetical protein